MYRLRACKIVKGEKRKEGRKKEGKSQMQGGGKEASAHGAVLVAGNLAAGGRGKKGVPKRKFVCATGEKEKKKKEKEGRGNGEKRRKTTPEEEKRRKKTE